MIKPFEDLEVGTCGEVLQIKDSNLLVEFMVCEGNEKLIRKLNLKIGTTYSNYYSFYPNVPKSLLDKMIVGKKKKVLDSLITQLIDRVNETNGGSYVLDDFETWRLKKILKSSNN